MKAETQVLSCFKAGFRLRVKKPSQTENVLWHTLSSNFIWVEFMSFLSSHIQQQQYQIQSWWLPCTTCNYYNQKWRAWWNQRHFKAYIPEDMRIYSNKDIVEYKNKNAFAVWWKIGILLAGPPPSKNTCLAQERNFSYASSQAQFKNGHVSGPHYIAENLTNNAFSCDSRLECKGAPSTTCCKSINQSLSLWRPISSTRDPASAISNSHALCNNKKKGTGTFIWKNILKWISGRVLFRLSAVRSTGKLYATIKKYNT